MRRLLYLHNPFLMCRSRKGDRVIHPLDFFFYIDLVTFLSALQVYGPFTFDCFLHCSTCCSAVLLLDFKKNFSILVQLSFFFFFSLSHHFFSLSISAVLADN